MTYDGDGHAVKAQEGWRAGVGSLTMAAPNYQVWSTVLGTALTEVSDTGTKLKTKVVAGGDVIAEQIVPFGSHVHWIATEPVTGSSARITQSGFFGDDERVEKEPFGQEVQPTEPPAEDPDRPIAPTKVVQTNLNGNVRPLLMGKTSCFDLPSQCRAEMLTQDLVENQKTIRRCEASECIRRHMPDPNDASEWGGGTDTNQTETFPVAPSADKDTFLESLTFCAQDIFRKAKGWKAIEVREMTKKDNGIITFAKGKQRFSVESGNDFSTHQLKQIAGDDGSNSKIYGITFRVGEASQVTHFGKTIRTDPTTTNYVGNEMNGWPVIATDTRQFKIR
ncbi:MAG: hypothetical protein IPK98_11305 [Chloracidobacterium sp.]|nr:hypothetical protein [Chloracidobacterium sp.]